MSNTPKKPLFKELSNKQTEITVPISSQEFSELMDEENLTWKIKADNKDETIILHVKYDKAGDFIE